MPMLVKDEFPYVDIDKVIKMCIIHDLGEAVTGDIPAFEKTDDDEIKEAQLLREFLSSLPENVKAEFIPPAVLRNAFAPSVGTPAMARVML